MRIAWIVALAAFCAGCGPRLENVRFIAGNQQQAIIRDGRPALVSRQKASVVLVRTAGRQIPRNGRPIFVIGISNLSSQPVDFRVANVQVAQTVAGESAPIKVITYEELVQEENARQAFRAIAVGLAAGANAASAANAGRYNSTSTVYTPRGAYSVHTTGYSPTAAAIAQSNAAAQNEAMISATIEQGQRNLVSLERGVIKDNTLMPGEWYGGQLHLAPLVLTESANKTYTISMMVGNERHQIQIVQEAAN